MSELVAAATLLFAALGLVVRKLGEEIGALQRRVAWLEQTKGNDDAV